jgi:hypothetical protein
VVHIQARPANAQGFVDGLAADGWLINFNWCDVRLLGPNGPVLLWSDAGPPLIQRRLTPS